jgi:hypothetical protein
MIRVLLDGVEISNQTEVDLSFVKKLDRELDEGFIVISHTDRKDQFPMFSIIDILENNTVLFSGRIASDMVELSSFGSGFYNHNLTLIEHTKLLEKFIVTGKTFTQPVGNVGVPLYTLFDVVDTLRKTSFLEKNGLEDVFAPFTITQEVEDELDAIIAPEFSFKDVTLRQALDEVANVTNSITRLTRENEIVFDKFNELLDQIDGVTENYKKQQDINYYSTNMSSDVINPISQPKDNLRESEYYPSKNLWTTLRSDFGRFDFESSFIPTPKPIYEISEVKTIVDLSIYEAQIVNDELTLTGEEFSNLNYELDITNNIVEKAEYDTLFEKPIISGFVAEKTKRNVIFYEYGKKNIQIGKTYGLFNIATAYRQMLQNASIKDIKSITSENNLQFERMDEVTVGNSGGLLTEKTRGGLFVVQGSSPTRRYFVVLKTRGSIDAFLSFTRWEGLFRVKYTPIPPSVRFEVVRDDITEVDVYSNQTINQKLRIVDLEAFANNMKGRINQLGESQLTLSHKVKNISQSWKIGDFTADKFVVTKKEVIVQRDHYIINYELNKNFNKISQFVGIDQEIRQWEIGESGRSLDRDLNYNEYIEIYADDEGAFSQGDNDTTLENNSLFLSTFNSNAQVKPITLATFSSNELLFDDGSPVTISVPFYRVSGGDSFGIYFDFQTNAAASDELRTGDEDVIVNLIDEAVRILGFAKGIPRYFNVPVKYTDAIGRLDTFNLSLYNEDDFGVFDFNVETNTGNSLPILDRTLIQNPVISGSFFIKKDNRERIKMTLQYHLVSKDVNEVIVGNKLSTHNFMSIESANQLELRTFTNRTFTKRDKDKVLNGFVNKYTSNFLTINETNSFIEVTQDLTGVDAWAITDTQGKPFIMVNGNKKRLVFEFRNKRDGVRYLRTGFQVKYQPPVIVSTSKTDSTVTMTLRNPNEDTVLIQSFLSSTINDGVQVDTVNANQEVTFTFTGLQPNKAYTFFLRCLNTNPSAGVTGNNGLKNSDNRRTSITTNRLPLDVPVVTIDSLIRNRFPNVGDGRDTGVLFSITNTNSVPLKPFYEIDDVQDVIAYGSLFETEQTTLGFDEEGNPILGVRLLPNEVVLQPNETKLLSPNLAFSRITPEDIKFRFETTTFENNFFSDFGSPITIDISPFQPPVYVIDGFNAPVITTNSIQVRWNNPNSVQAVIEVEIYSDSGLRIETKTATVNANSNVDVNFTGLQQSRTFSFRAKFLEGSGKLESIQVGNPLFTPQSEIIFVTTFDDFGASPIVTRVGATTNSLTIRYMNQDARDVVMSGGFSGSQLEQLGVAQGSGGFIEQTYTGLRAGDKYTFAARVRLVDEVRPAPEAQTTLFETFTRPSRPNVDLIGSPTTTSFAARAFNVGNAYPVEIRRDGILLNPSPVEPGAFADVLVTGLAPSSSNTFTFVSRLDGLDSATTTINVNTLGPLVNPVVTVESATFNSITPRIQNNNNRMVRAFGRFFPTNLSDLGLVTSGSSNIGLTYSDDFLQANRPLTFYSKFVDPADTSTETSIVQSTLYTSPLRAEDVIIEQVITSSGSIVSISLSFFNPNNQFGPNLNAIVSVFQGGGLEGTTTINNITPNFTIPANLTNLQMNNDDFLIIITLQNPTSSSVTEFYHEI